MKFRRGSAWIGIPQRSHNTASSHPHRAGFLQAAALGPADAGPVAAAPRPKAGWDAHSINVSSAVAGEFLVVERVEDFELFRMQPGIGPKESLPK